MKMHVTTSTCRRLVVLLCFIALISAQAEGARLEPTFKNVSYGKQERNLLDFWKATSDKPTPLVIYIHGGGFSQGDKGAADDNDIKACLAKGVSYASISYPYYIDVPLLGILKDNIARAVQFMRFKAADWNIDKSRIAVYGESAGAGASLWLAFHDDLANPSSADPVLRESTRVAAAGAIRTQATYDFEAWAKLFEGALDRRTVRTWQMLMQRMVLDMYHLSSERELKAKNFEPVRRELDMLSMIDKNDPPVFMETLQSSLNQGDLLHHSRHAKAVKKKCDSVGLECVVVLDEIPAEQRIDAVHFLLGRLK
jgi:carboxylesterase type B